MKRLCALVAAFLFTVLAAPASAYTVASFSLSGLTFNDGGTASGTFKLSYGSGPLPLFSPSATTTAGTILGGTQYDGGIVFQNILFASTEIFLANSSPTLQNA